MQEKETKTFKIFITRDNELKEFVVNIIFNKNDVNIRIMMDDVFIQVDEGENNFVELVNKCHLGYFELNTSTKENKDYVHSLVLNGWLEMFGKNTINDIQTKDSVECCLGYRYRYDWLSFNQELSTIYQKLWNEVKNYGMTSDFCPIFRDVLVFFMRVHNSTNYDATWKGIIKKGFYTYVRDHISVKDALRLKRIIKELEKEGSE